MYERNERCYHFEYIFWLSHFFCVCYTLNNRCSIVLTDAPHCLLAASNNEWVGKCSKHCVSAFLFCIRPLYLKLLSSHVRPIFFVRVCVCVRLPFVSHLSRLHPTLGLAQVKRTWSKIYYINLQRNTTKLIEIIWKSSSTPFESKSKRKSGWHWL